MLLSQKNYADYFNDVKTIVVDEWRQLLGYKRGVQIELAISRLKTVANQLQIWGISATVGNMDQALQVLLGNNFKNNKYRIIRANIEKKIEIFATKH